MPQSLVSIIIPCKNGVPWLAAAIESCLRQSWSNKEVIVVDNGSLDASLAVARRYEPAVTVLECHRPGASAARNSGLQRARGEFIQFLDADDLLEPGKIEAQMQRLAAAPALSLASGAWSRFRRDPSEASFAAEPVWRDLPPEEFLISSWLGGGMMPNFAWLTPRALIDRAGGWDERLSRNDDGEFFCRVVLTASHILFCGEARGYYRGAPGARLSGRRDLEALRSGYLSVALSCDHLLRRAGSAAAAKACATHYQRFAFDAYPQVLDLVAAAEREAARLGGGSLQIGGGGTFKIVSRCLGWKAAKRWQYRWRRLRAVTGRPSPAAI